MEAPHSYLNIVAAAVRTPAQLAAVAQPARQVFAAVAVHSVLQAAVFARAAAQPVLPTTGKLVMGMFYAAQCYRVARF